MQTAPYRFQLLAPSGTPPSKVSGRIGSHPDSFDHYLSSLQKLRARTYLADGAIGPRQLDEQGRFRMHGDEDSWHFLLIDSDDEAVGCVRYLSHSPFASFDDLSISHCPMAADLVWGSKFRGALEADLAFARENLLTFVEVGGWAIETAYRHTRAALEVLLASFAWARMIGGAIGCCTATFRNNSALMLRRIGGTSIEYNNEAIPPYEDAGYGCMMEVLRFRFQNFDPRFQKMVDDIYNRIAEQPTIAASLEDEAFQQEALRTSQSLSALDRALQSANQGAGAKTDVLLPA
jgi:hypothetical protein